MQQNLDKQLKKDLIAIVLAMQSKMSANSAEVLEEIRKLNSKFDILESGVLVAKKVDSESSSKLVNMERQCWANAQYLRRGCSDFDNIKDCHRLRRKSDNVTIRFSRRKDCHHVLWVKKDLQNFNLEDLGFPGENKSHINQNLCQCYQMLWPKSEKLHSMGRIHSYIAGESIKTKVHESSTPLAITHLNDFEHNFLDVDLLPTSTSDSGSGKL